ncbi:isochorismatase family protein [Actinomadura sp. 9N407]|uniref:isochorismatase family protein n=1 Tax=Actinomadura sp. 9N407 TaxID=3375154 RepID=UPI0037AA0BE7
MSTGPVSRSGAADADLAEDYTSAGFGRALDWGSSPAVIVIDMVRAYFQPGAELYLGGRDCLESAARVVAAARAAGVPVLHTRVAYGPRGLDGGLFYRKVAALRHFSVDAETPELGEIMPEVAPRQDELVLVKQYASAFFGTSLSATLAASRIDTLVICGVSTSGCVRATAVDAISHGYLPIVVRQAVGDRDPRPHEANLFDLQAKYAEVRDETEAVQRLKDHRP